MPLTNEEKRTIDYYNQKAEEWVASHGGYEEESYWKREIARFHELLPSGKVLEIGSGSGKDALALISLGYKYTGTDASQELIKIAQKRNPRANFLCQEVGDLDFPQETFDGFWIAATLLHIPKTRIDKALSRIKKVVKPGGVGFISMKQGEGEKTDQKTGRWFAYYSKNEFTEVLERNGFKVVETQIRPEEEDTWLVFYVRA